MRIFALALWFAAAALPASDPAGFTLWKSSDLRALEKQLGPKINAHKVAVEPLGSYGGYSFMMAHREGDGEAELHETQHDVFIVQSGQATLVVGGTVVDPRTTAPHEIRGPSIRGGARKPLAAGDIVRIPVRTPHQLLVESGHQITYFVTKIDEYNPGTR